MNAPSSVEEGSWKIIELKKYTKAAYEQSSEASRS